MASNNTIINCIPGRIRESRKAKGMSQTELALAMGSDKAAVSRLEGGLRTPDLVTLKNAADALDESLSNWFSDEKTEMNAFFRQAQERAGKLTPEQMKYLETMINTSLEMMGV